MKHILTTALLALSLTASAKEATKDTLVVTPTPAMHCQNCETKIKSNIRFVKGTKKILTSVPDQTVTIIYDNRKTSYSDYEKAFKEIGYTIKPASKEGK